ncbi:NHL repeat-containing protein [Aporhodopirellula aestuarii]|uniref:Peptidylglycine monooxygenase n=1 Tax=Aporhodopirellula aestuarii TaxID=2950107 RepID=A0ABT0U7S0_9BACT|nr:peptidylglycine monooxygenase [Aporhodopirellula aestuarii]MCM2372729.1 peptidylglycine monooxygenase [Aporhodopirellula aestuarii]
MSDRRSFLKSGVAVSAATAMLAHSSAWVNAVADETGAGKALIGHGDFRYRVNKDWATVNPFRLHIDNCHEMVQDSKGRLVMIGDDPRNNIIVFDKSGKVLDSWGTYWPGGHGLTLVDEGGEDVLFVSESGWVRSLDDGVTMVRQNGYVAKMTIDGRMLFTISHPMTVGAYTPEMLFQPTETAVAPNGDIYIADGYGSDFILRYDQHGKFIQKFGGRNNDDKNYNLANAHGVAFDGRDPANPKLIVTSRGQKAFKYFSLDGKWLKTVSLANLQICRPVIHGEYVYAGVCWSHHFAEVNVPKPWLYQSGFTMVMDKDDRVVSCPGGEQPVYENGILQPVKQDEARTFYHGHDVCIDEDENVYVCQWNGERTTPVKLERV